jgi:hypothetical protein
MVLVVRAIHNEVPLKKVNYRSKMLATLAKYSTLYTLGCVRWKLYRAFVVSRHPVFPVYILSKVAITTSEVLAVGLCDPLSSSSGLPLKLKPHRASCISVRKDQLSTMSPFRLFRVGSKGRMEDTLLEELLADKFLEKISKDQGDAPMVRSTSSKVKTPRQEHDSVDKYLARIARIMTDMGSDSEDDECQPLEVQSTKAAPSAQKEVIGFSKLSRSLSEDDNRQTRKPKVSHSLRRMRERLDKATSSGQPSRNAGEPSSVGSVLDALGKVNEALAKDSSEVSSCASKKSKLSEFSQSTTVAKRNNQRGSANKLPPPSPRKKRNFLRIPRESQTSTNESSSITSTASTKSKSSDSQRTKQSGAAHNFPPPKPRKLRNFLRSPRGLKALKALKAHKVKAALNRGAKEEASTVKGAKDVKELFTPVKTASQNQKLETVDLTHTEAIEPADTAPVTEPEKFDTSSTDSFSETTISSSSHDGDMSIEVETSASSACPNSANPNQTATERSTQAVEEVLKMTDHIVEEANDEIEPLSPNISSWAFAANFSSKVARHKGRNSGERLRQQKGSYSETTYKEATNPAIMAPILEANEAHLEDEEESETEKEAANPAIMAPILEANEAHLEDEEESETEYEVVASENGLKEKIMKMAPDSIIVASLKYATSDELTQLVNTLTEVQKQLDDDKPHMKGPPSSSPTIAAYSVDNRIPVANSIDTREGMSGCSRTTVPIANTQKKSGQTEQDIMNKPIFQLLEERISRDSSGDAYSYDYTEVSGFGTEDEGFLSNDTGALSDPPRDGWMTFSAETLSMDEFQDEEEDDDDIHSIGDLSSAVVEETKAVAKEIRDGIHSLEVGLTNWTRFLSCHGSTTN